MSKNFKNEDVIKSYCAPELEEPAKEKNTHKILLSVTESFYLELSKRAKEKELSVNSYIKTVLKESFK